MTIERDAVAFDEPWYLGRYPDVAAAVGSGAARDAWDHYLKVGQPEGRDAFGFDENWYLSTYPDVRDAIRLGQISSARIHYMRYGRQESRFPLPAGDAKRVIAYGSFGSNNVGDEAILEGIKRFYPDCIQIYHNRPRAGEGYLPSQLIGHRPFFNEGDYLILGGGGLLYDRGTVSLMADLARAALAANATVDILRIGCEAAQPEYSKEIIDLFSMARRITLRSTISREIMFNLTGELYPVEYDFAFNLADEAKRLPRAPTDMLTIGVVTASSSPADLIALAAVIRQHTRANAKRPVRFVHIPHSRSYFEVGNNDCVTGQALWTMCFMHQAADESLFQAWDYDSEPLSVLAKYKRLDGVMSSRYHGLIFGQLAGTPTLAIGGDLIKLRSYIDDHASDTLFVAGNMGELPEAFEIFLAYVESVRGM